ncbi:MAG TPA: ABC transporter substrate-binding protein [Candidatus Binatia bacterium]|nr:ABC transporter substrate-binding protein [Candidatus Binatia bacterium]
MRNLLPTLAALVLMAVSVPPSLAQEKKNLRMVFVSLAWNSEIPFRVAMARGFFKQQGLQIEPILIRGGPAAIAALVSGEVDYAAIGLLDKNFALDRVINDRILKIAQRELRAEGRIK